MTGYLVKLKGTSISSKNVRLPEYPVPLLPGFIILIKAYSIDPATLSRFYYSKMLYKCLFDRKK